MNFMSFFSKLSLLIWDFRDLRILGAIIGQALLIFGKGWTMLLPLILGSISI